jgi:hypothetical protein
LHLLNGDFRPCAEAEVIAPCVFASTLQPFNFSTAT